MIEGTIREPPSHPLARSSNHIRECLDEQVPLPESPLRVFKSTISAQVILSYANSHGNTLSYATSYSTLVVENRGPDLQAGQQNLVDAYVISMDSSGWRICSAELLSPSGEFT